MKRYSITILFKDGDRLEANVMARNQADAINRLKKSDEFIEHFGSKIIVKTNIEPIPIVAIDNERFAVTTIDNKPGWYVAVDLDNFLKVEFKKGMYNETNSVSIIGEGKNLSPLQAATALREIGEYLVKNFKELVQ